ARPLPACPNGRKAGQIQAPSKRTRRKYPDSAMGCCCGGKVTRTGGEVLQEAHPPIISMNNTPDSPAKPPDDCTYQGGNYSTLFTPGIWKVLHAVQQLARKPEKGPRSVGESRRQSYPD